MSVHITKTYNIGGLIGLRQNAVKNAGETLGFKEMSLFKFPDAYDSDDELHVRMDGIIASLCPEDIVIFQHPSGESPRYDGFLFEHLRRYHGTKIVAFIQEIAFDRDDSEYSLSDEITLLNRADMFIFASAALRDYYIANGLKEKPYLIQNIPDYMTDICANEHKNKKLYIMAETSQNEYPLNNLNIEVVQYDEYRAMESIEDDSTFYRIGAQVLYTKADLVGYMVKRLNLTADDVVIIDRTTGIGQAILENCGPARVGIVVHADHFSEGGTDDDYILWNNYYEYSFSQTEHIDFYITATDAQNELMRQQFKKYCGKEPQVVTIPVGSLDELKYPDEPRKRHSLITASRLATEKHCDWLVEAVVKAKESVPDISLDIYGKGGDEAKLKGLIGRLDCADYVHLMGQQKLDDVYKHYDAYVAASQSEGFGLTLMEAIGSGLPIVGFDVRYGNQTFIDDGQNGYRIPITDEMDQKEKIKLLSERIVRMFTEDDMDAFSGHSYEKAKEYLTKEVVHRWIELLK